MTREEFLKQRRQVRLLVKAKGDQFSTHDLDANNLSGDVWWTTVPGFSWLSVPRTYIPSSSISRVGRGPLGVLP